MFKGVSLCIPTVSILYFGLFSRFHCSPLTLYLSTPIFQQLSIYIHVSSTFTSYILWFYWCSIIFFSFSSFLEFHRVLSINMFYIWVCTWSCLVLCICLSFGSIFHVWQKTRDFCVSKPGLLHLTWCLPIASIYLQTPCHYSLWLNIYI
jgi:hypothetical protein